MKNLKSKIGTIILILFLFNSITLLADDDIVFIPDSAFKAVLVNHWPTIDRNGDGEIQISEAEAFDPHGETLKAYGEGVHDLTGIKAFINADWVITGGELITEIDVTGMENWLFLEIYYSNITELDLEGCTSLSTLKCNNNSNLTSVDVSNCENLYILECRYNNNLSKIIIPDSGSIAKLNIDGNNLQTIDISTLYHLTSFSFRKNLFKEIDITHLNNIYYLYCGENNLQSLELPEYSDLYYFEGSSNEYTEIDLSKSQNIVGMALDNNILTTLNLKNGNNTNITAKYLDITNNPNLKCVDVDDPSYSSENWTEYFDEGVEFSEDCNESITDNKNKSFFVFPNPATDMVTIKRLSNNESEIKIIDMTGRICYNKIINAGEEEIQIDISKFAIGTYIIEIENESELIIIER